MNNKIPLNKETLNSLYWIDNKSLAQIASLFSCSNQTIKNRFKEFGIPTRSVSASLIGREIHWAKKIGAKQKGKKLSSQTKKRISEARLKNLPPSWNKGLTKARNPDLIKYGHANENHWNWKGGVSSERNRLRQTSEYKLWRKLCFQRDNYECQHCGLRNCYLNVHHIISFADILNSQNLEKLFDTNNGITLCKTCHKKQHQKK